MRLCFVFLFLTFFFQISGSVFGEEEIQMNGEEVAREEVEKPFKGELELALEKQTVGPLSVTNFLKHAIRAAINQGVPRETIVFILLLPLIGVIVSALYYLIGLTGFGIFIPAATAISFLATGVIAGLILFGVILFLTLLTRRVLRKAKLHLRSRRVVILWTVSLGTFIFLFLAPKFNLFDPERVSIFPILLLVLLSEEFVRVQLGRSRKRAISLTLGTLLIAIIGAALLGWEWFQRLVLLHPETSFFLILFLGLIIGRYTGFRLLEFRRFKSVLRK